MTSNCLNRDEIYLRPSELRYSQISIQNAFKDGTKIGELLDDLYFGRCIPSDIKHIAVAKVNGQWYSADNRRLWVMKHLEMLDRVVCIPVKVRKKIFQGKMTTKNEGQSVKIRGGDPGGIVYNTIKIVEKENPPKKRKRRRRRGKKKNTPAGDGGKVSETSENVSKSKLVEEQSNEILKNRDTNDNTVTSNEALTRAKAPLHEHCIPDRDIYGSSDESENASAVVSSDDSEDIRENLDYDEGEFLYESMYESSDDEASDGGNISTKTPCHDTKTEIPFQMDKSIIDRKSKNYSYSQTSDFGSRSVHKSAQEALDDLISALQHMNATMTQGSKTIIRPHKKVDNIQLDAGVHSSKTLNRQRKTGTVDASYRYNETGQVPRGNLNTLRKPLDSREPWSNYDSFRKPWYDLEPRGRTRYHAFREPFVRDFDTLGKTWGEYETPQEQMDTQWNYNRATLLHQLPDPEILGKSRIDRDILGKSRTTDCFQSHCTSAESNNTRFVRHKTGNDVDIGGDITDRHLGLADIREPTDKFGKQSPFPKVKSANDGSFLGNVFGKVVGFFASVFD